MNPSRPLVVCILSGLTLLLAACADPGDEPASSVENGDEDELINGTIAADGDYRPTLLIDNRCTAVKVGAHRLLTAAHCVSGQAGKDYAAGQKLMFHTANAVNDSNVLALAKYAVIESVRIHPNYDATQKLFDMPDVAVIVVKGDALAGIPSAVVDLDPVALGSKLVITGYGCRQVQMGLGTGEHTLSSGTVKSVSVASLKLYPDALGATIDQNFVISPGPATQDGVAGVCSGDSGGPAYRTGKSQLTVAAITSWTSGATSDGPRVNALARLHEGSRHSVGEWLSQQKVILARPCKDAKRCTSPVKPPTS